MTDKQREQGLAERAERAKAAAFMNDPVNHPSHYTDGNIEVIDFIDDKKLGFCLGNTVKYIARAGKKDPAKKLEDLKKARWYLDHEIQKLSVEENMKLALQLKEKGA